MKIGVSSYSFSRLVRSGELQQKDGVAKAGEMGFDVLEFSSIAVPEGRTLVDSAAELREEAARVGVPITHYTVGADLLKGSGGDLQAEIERLKAEVDVAEILGSPAMRHDASGGAGRTITPAQRASTRRTREGVNGTWSPSMTRPSRNCSRPIRTASSSIASPEPVPTWLPGS